MVSEILPSFNTEPKQRVELVDDNARKFVVNPIDYVFLENNSATRYLIETDWLIIGQDSEKKVVRKQFENGDVQMLLISKVTIDGKRTAKKEKITEEQYDEHRIRSVCHVEKVRYDFKYPQDGVEFDVKYDEFVDSDLRILEVDASTESERELFTPEEYFSVLHEVTGDLQYYGYRVANLA